MWQIAEQHGTPTARHYGPVPSVLDPPTPYSASSRRTKRPNNSFESVSPSFHKSKRHPAKRAPSQHRQPLSICHPKIHGQVRPSAREASTEGERKGRTQSTLSLLRRRINLLSC